MSYSGTGSYMPGSYQGYGAPSRGRGRRRGRREEHFDENDENNANSSSPATAKQLRTETMRLMQKLDMTSNITGSILTALGVSSPMRGGQANIFNNAAAGTNTTNIFATETSGTDAASTNMFGTTTSAASAGTDECIKNRELRRAFDALSGRVDMISRNVSSIQTAIAMLKSQGAAAGVENNSEEGAGAEEEEAAAAAALQQQQAYYGTAANQGYGAAGYSQQPTYYGGKRRATRKRRGSRRARRATKSRK